MANVTITANNVSGAIKPTDIVYSVSGTPARSRTTSTSSQNPGKSVVIVTGKSVVMVTGKSVVIVTGKSVVMVTGKSVVMERGKSCGIVDA